MNVKTFFYNVACVACLAVSTAHAVPGEGGFSLGSTRVIYDESNKSATITVINSAHKSPILVQSWLENHENASSATKPPFVITPPLYRQDNGSNTLRIVKIAGNVPTDRESAYWLNVKAIPAQAKEVAQKNTISFAYVLKVKMFYRPAGLQGNPKDAAPGLTFSQQGEQLVVNNKSEYFVTLNKVSVGGKEIESVTAMVPPMGEQYYKLPTGISGDKVEYITLNDLGGLSEKQTKHIQK